MTTLEPIAAAAPKPTVSKPAPVFRVEFVDTADVRTLRAEWDALAENALVANPFFESWMLLPALDRLAEPTVRVGLIWRDGPEGRTLIGLAPFERFTRFHGLPCRGLRIWRHVHAVLGTPLLHRDFAEDALEALFDGAKSVGKSSLIDFDMVDAERAFAQALTNVVNRRRLVDLIEDQHNRAFFRPSASLDDDLAVLSGKHRQEYRRQRRRIGDLGRLESRTLEAGGPIDEWLEGFFRLEGSGWKGDEKTAFSHRPAERAFFEDVVRAAYVVGRLHMLGLFLDGRPIALKCNFLADGRPGGGAFALKIAYDEALSKHSPGVLLELDNIEDVHRRSIGWMDSCACANHPMIDRLWPARRALQRRVVSTGRRWANFVLGLSALGRAVKRSFGSR